MSQTKANTEFKFPFNVDEFRQDIINNVQFKELKEKYNIKLHIELDGYILRLSKLDNKIYDYQHSEVVRGLPVYESKNGWGKISPKEMEKIKSTLQCEKLVFGELVFDGKDTIIIEVKAA